MSTTGNGASETQTTIPTRKTLTSLLFESTTQRWLGIAEACIHCCAVLQVDYYKLLNVDLYASENEIRRAFKKRALLYHPDRLHDKNDGEKVVYEQMFKEMSLTHEILSDQPTRRQYDRDREGDVKTSAVWGKEGSARARPKKSQGVPDTNK